MKLLKLCTLPILGACAWLSLIIFVVVSLPVYAYRFLVSKVLAPFCSRKLVALGAGAMATDFFNGNTKFSSRNAVVVNMILEGIVCMNDIHEKLETRWCSAVDERGKLLYPEFCEYLEHWMGFMVWKKDDNFDINTHLYLHTLNENMGDEESEDFVRNLVENLLNKQFPAKRSPWEIHVLHHYKCSQLQNGPLTMILMRLHHAMSDGPSFISVVGEGLFSAQVAEMGLALRLPKQNIPLRLKLMKSVKYLTRLLYDMGLLMSAFYSAPWLVPDNQKSHIQLYARSNLIPIAKIKQIKNTFGTSFTAVLLSCVAAGVSKTLKKKHIVESMLIGIPIPLRGPSARLGIHLTATLLSLPLASDLSPIGRLRRCESRLNALKNSTISTIIWILQRVFLTHLAPMARFSDKNRIYPMYLTTFPGPSNDVCWHRQNKLVGGDYAVGGLNGNAGVGFIALSTNGFLRIAVTAENALLSKQEVSELITCIENEIDVLLNMQYEDP